MRDQSSVAPLQRPPTTTFEGRHTGIFASLQGNRRADKEMFAAILRMRIDYI